MKQATVDVEPMRGVTEPLCLPKDCWGCARISRVLFQQPQGEASRSSSTELGRQNYFSLDSSVRGGSHIVTSLSLRHHMCCKRRALSVESSVGPALRVTVCVCCIRG